MPQAIGASGLGSIPAQPTPCLRSCLDLRCIHPAPVDNSNSGHNQRRSVAVPHAPAYRLRSSAAMACPSGRVGEQLERHADKHRFPMRIRPGDRPPVQRSANRPLMWNCCRHKRVARATGRPSGFLENPGYIVARSISQGARSAKRLEVDLLPKRKTMSKGTHRSQAAQLIQLRYLT